ncbi:hypothetical protein E1A91_D08G115300v1 [Gossypium mustelinum]|uniref:Peptidase A1 domain-containing protein n=1 Tax=Gossypium mustelinum TaxID=34275 RepID=A0A5D2TUC8_GOSMU|nr:hypothetical protein E1A91_D08G115300v1 [Gossypium mustelinum]
MAASLKLSPFIFPLSFFFSHVLFASSLSPPPPPPQTTTLDISSSLKQAKDILSLDPLSFKPFATSQNQLLHSNSSSPPACVFSIPLHSRASLLKTDHTDYKSLVLSRLHRDSARFHSLTTKLLLALNGVQKSQILPYELSTPIISGTSLGSGEYFSQVGVGRPVILIGSNVSPVRIRDLNCGRGRVYRCRGYNERYCGHCGYRDREFFKNSHNLLKNIIQDKQAKIKTKFQDCYQQFDPIFNPSTSSTYILLSCVSRQCSSLDVSSCDSGKCLHHVLYGDGSYTMGEFVTEMLSFGNSSEVNNIALGCGQYNTGLFAGAAGLLGLDGGSFSLTSQIKATSFSYCLVDRDSASSSTLDFNSGLPADSVIASLIRNQKVDTFSYVRLIDFSVGGQPVQLPLGFFDMDDSGNGGYSFTWFFTLSTAVEATYSTIFVDSLMRLKFRVGALEATDAFVKLAQDLPITSGVALFNTCYDFSSMSEVSVPTVSFIFGSRRSLDLPAKNYLVPVDSEGTFCLAFALTLLSLSIIGNVQQ